ncbi:hypothetical protein WMW72_04610 [Paenibacillus filicis]|uniref:ABC transporter permease n=1 Tax=Paenibacillus filicis TaxID=669464 RepID=A0ABU9DE95_9BACL
MRYALRMAWSELLHKPVAVLLTALFSGFMGYACGLSAAVSLGGKFPGFNSERIFHLGLFYPDFLLLAVLPALGTLTFSKEYWSWTMFNDEPFLKRLQFYRMWAIPVKVIAWSRMLHMLLCLGAALLCFLSLFIWGSWPVLSSQISILEYTAYLFVWVCYAVALNGINPFMEFGSNGKIVTIASLVALPVVFIVINGAHLMMGMPLYVWLMDVVRAHLFGSIAVALAGSCLGLWLFQQALVYKLSRRNLP